MNDLSSKLCDVGIIAQFLIKHDIDFSMIYLSHRRLSNTRPIFLRERQPSIKNELELWFTKKKKLKENT